MDNLKPQSNVSLATISGFISAVILHVCKVNGIIIPDDVSSGLPAFIVAAVAYGHDCLRNGK